MGCARHARHLQRGLYAQGECLRRADPARTLREHSQPHHGALRPPAVGVGVDRHRRGRDRTRPGLRAQRDAPRRTAAAGRAAVHQSARTLRTLRGMLCTSIRKYEACMDDPQALAALDFQTLITLTKVEASELAAATVMHAMRACGLSGYRNDSEFSIGRHLRDVLSSPIMINNDRILSNLVTPALMSPMATSLRD